MENQQGRFIWHSGGKFISARTEENFIPVLRYVEPIEETMKIVTISQIPDDHILVTDSQEVAIYNEEFNQRYDSYFIKVENGDYVSAYGFMGCVPYLSKLATKVR